MTRSRSPRGTSCSTVVTVPPSVRERSVRPTVAVVFSCGAPAVSCAYRAGSSVKQLAAVTSHSSSTSVAVQLRLPSPMSSFTVDG